MRDGSSWIDEAAIGRGHVGLPVDDGDEGDLEDGFVVAVLGAAALEVECNEFHLLTPGLSLPRPGLDTGGRCHYVSSVALAPSRALELLAYSGERGDLIRVRRVAVQGAAVGV